MVAMLSDIKKSVKIGKRLFGAFRRYKGKFSLIVVMGFLAGLSGAFGIGVLIPLFYVLTGQEPEGLDFITQAIRGILEILNIPFTLPFLLLFAATLFVLKGVIQFLAKYLNQKISADYENSVRTMLFKKTMRASWPYLIEHKLGYLERILMRDTFVVSGIINQINSLILLFTSFLTYAFVAFKISPPITVATSLFGVILFLVFRPVLKKIKELSRHIRDTEKDVAHFINENIVGAKIIKASAAEKKVIAKGEAYFQKYKNDRLKTAFYQNAMGSAFEPISFAFIAVLMLSFYKSPSFEIASFAVIIYLIQKIFSFIQTGQNTAQDIIANIPYVHSIALYRKEAALNQEPKGGNRFSFKETIQFKNLRFSYNQDKNILAGINLIIKKGEMIGLIGQSGSGKTTLADLLMRLFSPESGEILVDSRNINEVNLRSWRKNLSYMPQDAFLLNDTIRNNIRFYNESLTEEDIIKSAKMANIFDLIKELPGGLDARIGERGVKISAGQRQRIALARALARKPQILILDEATSALDNQSEHMIQKAIEELRGKITIVVIAHRLSTIMSSDKVVVLEEGRIIEEGPPNTLLADKDSHFYQIYNILK